MRRTSECIAHGGEIGVVSVSLLAELLTPFYFALRLLVVFPVVATLLDDCRNDGKYGGLSIIDGVIGGVQPGRGLEGWTIVIDGVQPGGLEGWTIVIGGVQPGGLEGDGRLYF